MSQMDTDDHSLETFGGPRFFIHVQAQVIDQLASTLGRGLFLKNVNEIELAPWHAPSNAHGRVECQAVAVGESKPDDDGKSRCSVLIHRCVFHDEPSVVVTRHASIVTRRRPPTRSLSNAKVPSIERVIRTRRVASLPAPIAQNP
jgi:hypothetical protein